MSFRPFALLVVAAAVVWLTQSPAAAQNLAPGLGNAGIAGTRLAATSPDGLTEKAQPAPKASGPERRIALVIGNSAYEHVSPLPNPVGDAKAIAQLLSTAGFEVISASNLGRADMLQVIGDFAARIASKGPNTVALVFYAGHGLQVDGENFLVPVDAKITSEADVPEQNIRLFDLMKTLESVPSRMRIVILDACRNNPLGEAAGKGLAMVDAPTGSIVAYSTAPGTEASDGVGRHSPYAAAFMRIVKQPGLPIEQLFKKVRLLVHENTDGRQTPWESSSLTSDFVFFALGDNQVAQAPTQPAKVQLAELKTRSVRDAYEIVVQEDSVEYYEEFVRLYPRDPLCDHIRRLLARRKQMMAWHEAVKANSKDAYEAFLKRFPTIDLAAAARKLHERPRAISLPVFPRRPIVGRPFPIGPIGKPFPNGNKGHATNGQGNSGPLVGKPNGAIGKPTGPIVNNPSSGQGNNGQNGSTGKPTGPIVSKPTGSLNVPNGGLPKPGTQTGSSKPTGNVVTLPPGGLSKSGTQTGPATRPTGKVMTLPPQDRIRDRLQTAPRGQINTLPARISPPIVRQPRVLQRAPIARERLAPARQTLAPQRFSVPRQLSVPRASFGGSFVRGGFRR